MERRKVVFLDRDGTINRDEGYTVRPVDLQIFAGAGAAVGALKRAGYTVVVVTNHSAVGRGMATLTAVEATNEECRRQLLAEDPAATIDAICVCPHSPSEKCRCRKPLTGMLESLSFGWNPEESWMVGDKLIDIQFGRNLGVTAERCILVRTGHGSLEEEAGKVREAGRFRAVDDLPAAVTLIVGGTK